MRSTYALMVTILTVAFSQVPAESSEVPSNNKPKTILNFEGPVLKVGEPFLAARSRILRFGWKPIRMQRDYEYIGTEKELVSRRFREVDYCSMDAGSLCVLYYRKGTKCLRLGTVGEQLNYMKVTRWTDECPVAENSPRDTP